MSHFLFLSYELFILIFCSFFYWVVGLFLIDLLESFTLERPNF